MPVLKIRDENGNFINIPALVGEKGDTGIGIPIGGTTEQILVKASNKDFDTKWVNQIEIEQDLSSRSTTSVPSVAAVQTSIQTALQTYDLFVGDATETFNLNDNILNYKYAEIYFYTLHGHRGYTKVVCDGSSIIIPLANVYRNPSSEAMESIGCTLTIQGTIAYIEHLFVSNQGAYASGDAFTHITRIIGYK